MSILWLILAVAFAIAVLKVTLKLLKFVFTVGFITAAALFIGSFGVFF